MASMAVNEIGPMLTATEVAQMLHLHVNTVKRLGDRGELPFYRVCKRGDRRFRLEGRDAVPGDQPLILRAASGRAPAAVHSARHVVFFAIYPPGECAISRCHPAARSAGSDDSLSHCATHEVSLKRGRGPA